MFINLSDGKLKVISQRAKTTENSFDECVFSSIAICISK